MKADRGRLWGVVTNVLFFLVGLGVSNLLSGQADECPGAVVQQPEQCAPCASCAAGLLNASAASDAHTPVDDPVAGQHGKYMETAPISPSIRRETVFRTLLDYLAAANITGDYVETGVWRGSSAAATAAHLVCTKQLVNMKLWLYDAWLGMPETRPEDGKQAEVFFRWGWGKEGGGYHPSSLNDALTAITRTGFNADTRLVVRKGWFNETFLQEKPKSVAFLHIDGDWYASITDTLLAFYDLVPVGGVVLFDDFGFWEGARRAFYDFFARRGEHPLLERADLSQAWFVKGKEHNRAQVQKSTTIDRLQKPPRCAGR